jgi:hypothetical protein
MKSRGAIIAYRPDAKLECVIRENTLIDHLVPPTAAFPPADHNVMLGDLPYLTCFDENEQPRNISTSALVPASLQLTASKQRVAAMQERLSALGPPPYIGLTWRGGTPPDEQAAGLSWMLYKEIPTQHLCNALSGIEGTFIALQRNPGAGEINRMSEHLKHPLHDFTDANDQLDDMLALLALLDEYIGVSNTNMHLRAGVGKTARVLVPCPPEWRWMARGDESPWFPGFSIYRQTTDGNWNAALARLSRDLAATGETANQV